MKNVKIVIGANFGDEGKGLVTDYLSSTSNNGIVIRFNGGAQAGHTVITPDGKKHVYSHIGAGTFCGLPTYLSHHFIINPLLYLDERERLLNEGVDPKVIVDQSAKVTTPYEMMINQIVEITRGANRHGSCGLGINETIVRNNHGKDFEIYAKDLLSPSKIRKILNKIKNIYVPYRLHELGIKLIPNEFTTALNSDAIIDNFIDDIQEFLKAVEVSDATSLLEYNDYIFEGAQGLMLDENYVYFPYVTHSKTGLFNALRVLSEINEIDENIEKNIEIFYVTRAYLTRHGAGPLFMELENKPYPRIVDETNFSNQFQGSLRFAHLDIDRLRDTIKDDLEYAKNINYTVTLVMSCLDQVDEMVKYIVDDEVKSIDKNKYPEMVINHLGFELGMLSYSPTRENKKIINLKGAKMENFSVL